MSISLFFGCSNFFFSIRFEESVVFYKSVSDSNLNFLKMHLLSKITDQWKKFGAIKNLDTTFFEKSHRHFAKEPFQSTNYQDILPQVLFFNEFS